MEQINARTLKPYGGVNQIALGIAKSKFGFDSNQWMTFLQAQEMGLRIKKGSKGVSIVKMIEVEGKKDKNDTEVVPRHYTVFNLEQTHGEFSASDTLVNEVDKVLAESMAV